MRALTKKDKERGKIIIDHGCIVCEMYNGMYTPCGIHHIDGKTKKGCHEKTIGLCSRHHQIPDTAKPKRWVALHHDGRAMFEKTYSSEKYLLQLTNGIVNDAQSKT